jgi:hypothetical protein
VSCVPLGLRCFSGIASNDPARGPEAFSLEPASADILENAPYRESRSAPATGFCRQPVSTERQASPIGSRSLARRNDPEPSRASLSDDPHTMFILVEIQGQHRRRLGRTPTAWYAPPVSDVNELSCLRCKSRLLAESAVSVVIEVAISGRVVERLQFFDLHPACARLAASPEINRRKRKYAQRSVEIRHMLVTNR